MLINWGISSIEVFLINFPTFVILGSSFILNIGPDISFCFNNFSLSSSAFETIERILYILNVFPSFPTLSCENKTGPSDSNFIAIATIIRAGLRQISPNKDNVISKNLLKNK